MSLVKYVRRNAVKPTKLSTVIVAGLLALPFLIFASQANATTESGTISAPHQRPDTPLMVWRGVSEVGYLRVELWNRPTASDVYNQDIVVKSASRGCTETYSGVMISLPPGLNTKPEATQMFICVADDGIPGFSHLLSILATLSEDGTLHLYKCGMHSLFPPCDLHPVE
jgi:hypothetical protein